MTPSTSFEGSRDTAGVGTSRSAVVVMRSRWKHLKQDRSCAECTIIVLASRQRAGWLAPRYREQLIE